MAGRWKSHGTCVTEMCEDICLLPAVSIPKRGRMMQRGFAAEGKFRLGNFSCATLPRLTVSLCGSLRPSGIRLRGEWTLGLILWPVLGSGEAFDLRNSLRSWRM